jgi:hypothetical protein
MATFTIAGQRFDLDRTTIEAAVVDELPDPVRDHYVVVEGRRFPPKQILARVTGLDRADFTTHHARRILSRLGFMAGRRSTPQPEQAPPQPRLPHGGRQAAALAPYIGKWVALGEPWEVLVAADTPQEVLRWLERHDKTATGGMFRVPRSAEETEIIAPQILPR